MGLFDKIIGRRGKGAPELSAIYVDMRAMWLTGPMPDAPAIGGVVAFMMEMGLESGCACFLAAADGSASMYRSKGGGSIGGQHISAIANAAKRLVEEAARHLAALAPTPVIVTTGAGVITFCARTTDGLRAVQHAEHAVKETQHPLHGLFVTTHALITELRLAQQPKVPLGIYLHSDGGLLATDADHPTPSLCTLAELKMLLGAAGARGSQVVLHAGSAGGRAYDAVASVVRAIPGVEVAAAPDAWPGGGTTLHLAISAKRLDVIEDLLERGADLTARDDNGYDALLLSCFLGTGPIVAAILRAGADVNAQDRDGNSPLMFAAQRQDADSVGALLAAGADPNRRGKSGLTALAVARQYRRNPAIRILERAGATV